MTKVQPGRSPVAQAPGSSAPELATPGHNSNAFFLGPRKIEIWPGDQSIATIDRGIAMTRFADIGSYHGALRARILEEEGIAVMARHPLTLIATVLRANVKSCGLAGSRPAALGF